MKVVQIGACQGNDHVTRLIKDKDIELLILVEPNPLNIPALRKCYEHIGHVIIEEIGISPKDDDMFRLYYSLSNGPDYQISSLDMEHLVKHHLPKDSFRHFDITCKTLTSFLKSHNITELDYLFIDIEGYDSEVILSFNPADFDIKHIQIEMLHLGDNKDNVINHFTNNGYVMTDGIDLYGYDKMFVKK